MLAQTLAIPESNSWKNSLMNELKESYASCLFAQSIEFRESLENIHDNTVNIELLVKMTNQDNKNIEMK